MNRETFRAYSSASAENHCAYLAIAESTRGNDRRPSVWPSDLKSDPSVAGSTGFPRFAGSLNLPVPSILGNTGEPDSGNSARRSYRLAAEAWTPDLTDAHQLKASLDSVLPQSHIRVDIQALV